MSRRHATDRAIRIDLHLDGAEAEAVIRIASQAGIPRSEAVRRAIRIALMEPDPDRPSAPDPDRASDPDHPDPDQQGGGDPDHPAEPPEGAPDLDLGAVLDAIEVGSRVTPTAGLYAGVRGWVTKLTEGRATVEFKSAQGNLLTATLAVDQLRAL